MKNTVSWTEQDNIIRFSLTENGRTGQEWLAYFRGHKVPVSGNARKMLKSGLFVPYPAGTIFQVVVIKVRKFPEGERSTSSIQRSAKVLKFLRPNSGVAPHIRDAFSDDEIKQMGLKEIVTFHEPIMDRFLDIDTDDGELESAPAGKDDTWHPEHGVAFVSNISLPR